MTAGRAVKRLAAGLAVLAATAIVYAPLAILPDPWNLAYAIAMIAVGLAWLIGRELVP